MMNEAEIVVRGLHKYYGRIHAVRGASFTVPRATVYGLLGPNGAGKTTTIKTIVGLLRPTRGEVLVRGLPAGTIKAKSLIGYAPENFSIGGSWRLLDFLVYVGVIYGLKKRQAIEKALSLLEWVGLEGWEQEMFSSLSAGMRRRLGIAQALMGDPEILILDEPTEHLDAPGRLELLGKIRELASMGKTIVLSTHVLAEAELVVRDFAIMHKGRVVFQGRTDRLGGDTAKIVVDDPDKLVRLLKKHGLPYRVIGSQVIIENPSENWKTILGLCIKNNIRVIRYEGEGGGLSEFFMKIVGENSGERAG